jgi:hypothetical protein
MEVWSTYIERYMQMILYILYTYMYIHKPIAGH